MDGELDENDFLIPDIDIKEKSLESHGDTGKIVVSYYINISEYNHLEPIRFLKKNDRFQEPFIFFGKKINTKPYNVTTDSYIYQHYKPIVYYEYVAFNKGITPFKSARFKKVNIHQNLLNCNYSFSDVDNISKIPEDALIQLKDFLDKKRDPKSDIFEKTTFCNTIYTAVEEELINIRQRQQ